MLNRRVALAEVLQAFGDLVAVEILVGAIQHREQYQADQARIQFALEFLRQSIVFRRHFVD